MDAYLNFIDRVNNVVKYLVSILFIALVVLVFMQVVTRFIINYPLSWTEEISRYLMIYIVFIGSALAVRTNEHIAIDFLLEIISPKNKKRLNIITLFISVLFFAMLTYFGFQLTLIVFDQATPTLQFSMAWAYAAIPAGSLLMILNVFAVLIQMKKRGMSETEGEVQ
ncbi:TRAP transporter small permease [Virgibacillus sp. NKC19-3]|uniref:TRAP transporter small permease n=1 Tax=Virgibacillus saliphilus TaxID=2831674 RepID=UPI001C9B643E|nr:TRAP transporter small permease [Virgibacillus sp. NKC19-3]MBY7144476.1 TRAP transporter small permease [Virgibacillus sp. NKC19-3]